MIPRILRMPAQPEDCILPSWTINSCVSCWHINFVPPYNIQSSDPKFKFPVRMIMHPYCTFHADFKKFDHVTSVGGIVTDSIPMPSIHSLLAT
eukprot:1393539-Amorphochlora_amoeboformis.AAC.2